MLASTSLSNLNLVLLWVRLGVCQCQPECGGPGFNLKFGLLTFTATVGAAKKLKRLELEEDIYASDFKSCHWQCQ